jgi:uncharacterized protein (DUF433 family)
MGKSKDDVEIRRGAGGDTAYISGTRVRISDVARLYRIMQEEVIIERMRRSLPSLTSEQLTSALAYWRAHEAEIEQEIQEEDRLFDKIPASG